MEDRLARLYDDHAPALYRFLLRLTGHEADTRDALKDLFLRVTREPALLDGVDAVRPYLFRMAHRLVIDRARREHARRGAHERAARETPPQAAPDLSHDEAAWLRSHLAAALGTLPPEQRAVVALKVWEEMTFAEIAAALDIPPNTAASRYRYALDKLRSALRPLHRNQP